MFLLEKECFLAKWRDLLSLNGSLGAKLDIFRLILDGKQLLNVQRLVQFLRASKAIHKHQSNQSNETILDTAAYLKNIGRVYNV